MPVHVGTSGWQYASWRDVFYPGLPQRTWLAHYGHHFACVEVNNTFYRLPSAATFDGWAAASPDDFVFALKVSRYLTHVRRLRDPHEPVRTFLDRAERLGDKCGPLLIQLPPTFRADPARLDDCLGAFPARHRVAVEFRHPSWFSDEVRRVLTRHNAALCLTDRGERGLEPPWRTADFWYVRFHEGCATPHPCYRRARLAEWARTVAAVTGPQEHAYAFFNNDPRGCALRDAGVFGEELLAVGRHPTRFPSAVALG